MSQAIPDITPREANIRRCAHIFHCWADLDRATAIARSEGLSDEEIAEGRELAQQREDDARQLVAAIKENPWPA